jgi:D-alanine-D-alanine ligase
VKVAIIFDAGSSEWSPQDVAAVLGNVNEIRGVLRGRGHEAELVPVRHGDFRWLTRARRADLIFNLCEGINGHARFEDYVVGTLERTGVPFTGCRHWPTTICHRKHVANTLLSAAGVPVPAFTLAQANKIPSTFVLPAIVKPAAEDASVGIDNAAVCTTRKALKKRVAQMLEQFDEVIVQEYVGGREFNVGFVGKQMLPISEIRFDLPDGSWPIVSYAAKWNSESAEYAGTTPVCPADAPAEVLRKVGQVARQAWEMMSGGEGYGRVDLRVSESGQPYVLEVNPCPDLSSDAGLANMARALGWGYDELVMQVVEEALSRSAQRSAAAALTGGDSGGVPA